MAVPLPPLTTSAQLLLSTASPSSVCRLVRLSLRTAAHYPIPVHTDHCAKKLLPWLDGMLEEDEKFFKQNGVPLFSSHMIDLVRTSRASVECS